VRLPDAGRAEEDHILPALDEAELVQALHLVAAQRRLKREVEVVRGTSSAVTRNDSPCVTTSKYSTRTRP
jgi:hypothetical protein